MNVLKGFAACSNIQTMSFRAPVLRNPNNCVLHRTMHGMCTHMGHNRFPLLCHTSPTTANYTSHYCATHPNNCKLHKATHAMCLFMPCLLQSGVPRTGSGCPSAAAAGHAKRFCSFSRSSRMHPKWNHCRHRPPHSIMSAASSERQTTDRWTWPCRAA
jgi:hypothetical protein